MICVRSIMLSLCLVALSAGNLLAASADEEAISKFMNQDMAAAWKSNKPGPVLEIFTEAVPVVWLDADKNEKPVTSKDGRKKELETFFDKVQVVDFVVTDMTVTKLSDTLALVTCTEKITIVDRATKEQEQMLARTVYEVIKEKDKWRAYREISFGSDAVN